MLRPPRFPSSRYSRHKHRIASADVQIDHLGGTGGRQEDLLALTQSECECEVTRPEAGA